MAFNCKKRGFCPACGARRMAETAALLADDVLPVRWVRHWVLSLPYARRFLPATDLDTLTGVLGAAYRAISGCLLEATGPARTTDGPGRPFVGLRGCRPKADSAEQHALQGKLVPPVRSSIRFHIAANWNCPRRQIAASSRDEHGY